MLDLSTNVKNVKKHLEVKWPLLPTHIVTIEII